MALFSIVKWPCFHLTKTTGWAEAQGLSMGLSPEVLATRQAQGGGQGGFGQGGNFSEEDRAAIRATTEASGMKFGGDRGNLSQGEREAMRATAEASGMEFGNRGFRGRAGQFNILTQPLIELLTQRAAE